MNSKHTSGPVVIVCDYSQANVYRLWDDDQNYPDDCSPEVMDANAALIAEAFNVAHETGLTPRQLVEQRVELWSKEDIELINEQQKDLLEVSIRCLREFDRCTKFDADGSPFDSLRDLINSIKAEAK